MSLPPLLRGKKKKKFFFGSEYIKLKIDEKNWGISSGVAVNFIFLTKGKNWLDLNNNKKNEDKRTSFNPNCIYNFTSKKKPKKL